MCLVLEEILSMLALHCPTELLELIVSIVKRAFNNNQVPRNTLIKLDSKTTKIKGGNEIVGLSRRQYELPFFKENCHTSLQITVGFVAFHRKYPSSMN